MKTILYKAFAFFSCIWLFGCNRAPAPSATGLISSPGDFKSPDQKYALHIEISPKRLVFYSIKDFASGQIVVSDTTGTNLQRWFFYWDNESNLWVHSSDIGGCVWQNNNGKYAKRTFDEKDDLRAITPPAYYQNLPDAIKRP